MSEENKNLEEEVKETANDFTEGAKEAFDNLSNAASGDNKKMLAGILAIFLGSLGVHKFILGYQKEGIILLVATLIGYATSCIGIGVVIVIITWIIGLVEGIIYLMKSDEEFYETYQVNKKPWF